jgi:SulP family sulfate permease
VHRYRHLLVGLTRSSEDAGLIRYAAMLLGLGVVEEVRFVHVLPMPADLSAAHDHDHVLGELRQEVASYLGDIPDRVQVYYDVLKGPLTDRLLAFAAEQEADLIVVGHRRGSPRQRFLARRLAMKAPCSVWMVPEGSPATLDRVLVPIDFSEPAADAMLVATSMARLSGHSALLALHVYFNEARVTYEEYDQVLRGQEQEAFRRFLAPIDCKGVDVMPLFVEGANVAHVIGRTAQEQGADLIIMATRGRSRSAAILLGSVTEDTIVETRLPLLVVKHFGARMGVLQVLLDRRFRHRGGPQTD